MSITTTPRESISPKHLPAKWLIRKGAVQLLPEEYTGDSRYRVLGMAYSTRLLEDKVDPIELLTIPVLPEGEMERWERALRVHGRGRYSLACWTRFGLDVEVMERWMNTSMQSHHTTSADAYLAERVGVGNPLYTLISQCFSNYGMYGPTLSWEHVNAVGALATEMNSRGVSVPDPDLIEWYRGEWDVTAAGRLAAAGVGPKEAEVLWSRGIQDLKVLEGVATGRIPMEWALSFSGNTPSQESELIPF